MENYKKVHKDVARKMYNNGCSILLLPCKIKEVKNHVIGGKLIKPIPINIIDCEYMENKFDRTILNYEHFNCRDGKLGYYASYYVSDSEIEKYEMCKLVCN